MASAVNEYYVYEKSVTHIAGMVVVENEDGNRMIRLSPQQASYLMNQGIIGTVPKNSEPMVAEQSKRLRYPRQAPAVMPKLAEISTAKKKK